ncbi:hypothetical protein [uncultured Alsobacter sp.]|uniref:hypothetical protein n=1 Tax=uncultured Alsobacter sp. TaxID=1748258 RepID=UPI0025E5D938|nr:hypothetical protein [uncultured Alsobacter sp.]
MTEVRIGEAGETASEVIVKAAQNVAEATDANGRVIKVKVIGPVELYRLTKVLGAFSSNQATMNMAMSACSVIAIGGEPVSPPSTEREIEAVLQRLGYEGLAAAGEALQKVASTREQVIEQAKN